MKWLSPVLVLVTGALAISSATPMRLAMDHNVTCKLKVNAPGATPVHGHYLAIDPDERIGVLDHVDPNTAPRFYSARVQGSTTDVSLHLFPRTANDCVLALSGHGGLCGLRIAASPIIGQAPIGGQIDWESFTLSESDDGFENGANDSASHSNTNLVYSKAKGSWLAIQKAQGFYEVVWYDEKSLVVETYTRINITCKSASE